MNTKTARTRRAKRTRLHIRRLDVIRLTIYKSGKHIYAQIMSSDGSKTLVSASTLEKDIKSKLNVTSNKDAAKEIGNLVAQRAIKAGIVNVAFDRSGYIYHGRVKALADAARAGGLVF